MRKVLLASTALVALGSVQAMAADISISGSTEMVLDMGDSAVADASSLASETDINITFSNTSDSGITTSMNYGIDEGGANDDMIVTISGDFGSLSYTNAGDDHALNGNDIDPAGTAEERAASAAADDLNTATYTGGLSGIGNDHVTYTFPSLVDGLKLAVSLGNAAGSDTHDGAAATDTGEAASYVAVYDAGMLKVTYGEVRGHVQTDTHVGVSIPFGPATIQAAQNSNDQANRDNSATLIGVTYKVSDALTVGLESDKGENGTVAHDYQMTSIGASYTIAPGLSASFTSAETDGGDSNDADLSTTYTSIGLHLSF